MISEEKIILGIDPGTNLLGFGVIRISSGGRASYVDMGVLDLRKESDPYLKLSIISGKVGEICDRYHPDHMAIESPFYGKNAQVIFKLGRAQGAAIVAAKSREIEVFEYAPRKAKIAICGNGAASKEQVAIMVSKTLGVELDPRYLDATDALALAMCHFFQLTNLLCGPSSSGSWKKFLADNPERIKK